MKCSAVGWSVVVVGWLELLRASFNVILLHNCYIKIYTNTSSLQSISYYSLCIVISSAFVGCHNKDSE